MVNKLFSWILISVLNSFLIGCLTTVNSGKTQLSSVNKYKNTYLKTYACASSLWHFIFLRWRYTDTPVHHRLTEIIGLENLHYLFLHSKWSMNGFLKSGQRLPQISIHLVIKSEYINQWLAQMRIVKSIVSSNQHRSICSDQNRSMVWKIRKDQAMVCKIQNQTINDLLKYE